MFGVRVWAEETLRFEWKCSSVKRFLCDLLFSCIKENRCLHRYVLPNTESVWAAVAKIGIEVCNLSCACKNVFCLRCVITLELNQFHLYVWRCALYNNCGWVTAQLVCWDCISPQISNTTCFSAKILFNQNENISRSAFFEVNWSENLVKHSVKF